MKKISYLFLISFLALFFIQPSFVFAEGLYCDDSDGGLDYNTASSIYGPNRETGEMTGMGDNCADSSEEKWRDNKYLAERFCNDNEGGIPFIDTKWHKCPRDCEGGACVDNYLELKLGGWNFGLPRVKWDDYYDYDGFDGYVSFVKEGNASRDELLRTTPHYAGFKDSSGVTPDVMSKSHTVYSHIVFPYKNNVQGEKEIMLSEGSEVFKVETKEIITNFETDLIVSDIQVSPKFINGSGNEVYRVKISPKPQFGAGTEPVKVRVQLTPTQPTLANDSYFIELRSRDFTIPDPRNSVPYLNGGDEYPIYFDISPSSDEKITITATVDIDNITKENNEDNNTLSKSFYLKGAQNNLNTRNDGGENVSVVCGDYSLNDGVHIICKGDRRLHIETGIEIEADYIVNDLVHFKFKNIHEEDKVAKIKGGEQAVVTSVKNGKKIRVERIRRVIDNTTTLFSIETLGEKKAISTLRPAIVPAPKAFYSKPATVPEDFNLKQKKEEILGSITDIDTRISELRNLRKSFTVHLDKVQDLIDKIREYNFVGIAAVEIAEEVAKFENAVMNEDLSSEEINRKKELLQRRFEIAKGKAKKEKFIQKIIPFEDTDDNEWFTPFVKYAKDKGVISGYKDSNGNLTGRFGPGDAVTRAQILKMALEMADYDPAMKSSLRVNHWVKHYIQKAHDLGVGFNITNLDSPATRAEVVKLIAQVFKLDISNYKTSTFIDVKDSDIPYVEAAKKAGIIDGYSDGTFGPKNHINRAEASKILSNAEGVK